jgi:hypothetical protein
MMERVQSKLKKIRKRKTETIQGQHPLAYRAKHPEAEHGGADNVVPYQEWSGQAQGW